MPKSLAVLAGLLSDGVEERMQYMRLGKSSLWVSRVGLGCMSYGDPQKGWNPWVLGEEAAAPFFRQAVELGITLWDTANIYSEGVSEEIVGRAIRKYSRREDVILATKVGGRMHDGSGGSGLSRKAILAQVEGSLRRLGTDYIDLYQLHSVDMDAPFEETMDALQGIVKAGKVRYLGASNARAWQLASMQHAADRAHGATFVSVQHQYNLLFREEEREVIPLLEHSGVSSLPWSPLARGRLARPVGATTDRSDTDALGRKWFEDAEDSIIEAVQLIADRRGVPMAQVALAWVLAKSPISAPIVGATRSHHLTDADAALDLQLNDDEITALEANYRPRPLLTF